MKLSLFVMIALTVNFVGRIVVAGQIDDEDDIKACFKDFRWHDSPFKEKMPKFRTIETSVSIFGSGGSIEDIHKTDNPELVLIKPSVAVMSKATMDLLNPNGWYCLKGKVSVLGKTEINLDCKAHIASSAEGATVLGSSDSLGDVTVLGASRLRRVHCGDDTKKSE